MKQKIITLDELLEVAQLISLMHNEEINDD